MLIGSLAIAGHPAAGRLLLEGRDPRRVVQERLRVGLGDRLRRGRPDRVLHVPADGPDLLGRRSAARRRSGTRSTSRRRSMTDPAHPAGDPVGLPRACTSGLPLGASRITELAGAGLRRRPRRSSTATRREPAFSLFGIDGAADPRQRRRSRSSAWSSRGACSASSIGPIRMPARPERVRELTARRPVPVPRLAQQVVVRRPQPPAVHGHRRPDRGAPVVVRPRGRRRHRQRASARRPSTPARGLAPGPDRPRPELRARASPSG